jgi:uncharacterized protein YjlB
MHPSSSIQNINIIRHLIDEDGEFPNNQLLPLIVYQKALSTGAADAKESIIELFETNEWIDAWVDGIYDYHHFHSTAHEVLGVISGSARVQFGGPNGIGILLEIGDAVVIPAGVAHKAIEIFDNFQCIGAYPAGQKPDILKGKPGEKEIAHQNVKAVGLPLADPIYGTDGPLILNWTL